MLEDDLTRWEIEVLMTYSWKADVAMISTKWRVEVDYRSKIEKIERENSQFEFWHFIQENLQTKDCLSVCM